mgnify:CR=1 FL=1
MYPRALGSYFLLHRLDGKLVGCSVLTIANKYLESGYFMYDTDYKFLNLGVMGAIRELEYLRLIREQFNPEIAYYQLGTTVPHCPKVNYKMNYKPGTVLCPRTKVSLPWSEVKQKVAIVQSLSIRQKLEPPHVQLIDEAEVTPELLENETLVSELTPSIGET